MTTQSGAIQRAPLATLSVLIEAVNDRGVKANGQWIDYGRTFQGDKLGADAVGQSFELTLVKAMGGQFIRSARKVEETVSAGDVGGIEGDEKPETAAAAPPSASPEALQYAEDLALKCGISSEDLCEIAGLRFRKEWEDLTAHEASLLIEFFGGRSRRERRAS